MRTLTVNLPGRSYPIHIGTGLLDREELMLPFLLGEKVLVVTNTTVEPIYLEKLQATLKRAGKETYAVILPDGESYKNWETLNLIFDGLLSCHCERKSSLIALGGGVVGDMGGFAAACYQRGMPFVQVPTTLLAQVDSSVGGKTGINHPFGKNMIGAFHQPKLVIADISTLLTLDDRQLRAGLSEIIKMSLIRDASLFVWLEENMERLLARDMDALSQAVERACTNKAEVVVGDELEIGERALLNLGHTFGHAIEAGMGFGVWLHGEAVAAGTLMAAELSYERGWICADELTRVESLFKRAGLPVYGPPSLEPSIYLDLMRHDKKIESGQLRLVLLKSIGRAVLEDVSSAEEIIRAIKKRILPDCGAA